MMKNSFTIETFLKCALFNSFFFNFLRKTSLIVLMVHMLYVFYFILLEKCRFESVWQYMINSQPQKLHKVVVKFPKTVQLLKLHHDKALKEHYKYQRLLLNNTEILIKQNKRFQIMLGNELWIVLSQCFFEFWRV